ncbi:MAG: TolC family protein [Armatimonadetes bacterium]|nr:TolC family protein [Armatimonadota bacterium]
MSRQSLPFVSALLFGALCLPQVGLAQKTLSLLDAIEMAKQRNGDVRSAYLDLQTSRSRVKQAFADFLPTVIPNYRYLHDRSQVFTGASAGSSTSNTRTSSVSADWLLLDLGQRDWSYRAARRGADASEASTTGTVRNVLFAILQRYFDTIRARELLRVSETQVNRAETTLEATKLQIEVGAAPKKDELQAKADLLNAKVGLLQSQNLTATSESDLKAIIGWNAEETLPDLEKITAPSTFPEVAETEDLIKEGLRDRPDLVALRKRVEAQEFSRRIAERNSQVSLSVSASYDRFFSPLVQDSRQLTVLASMPLFDGGYSKESARQARYALESLKAQLMQAERDAVADIESARTVLAQNVLRVQASQAALDAARLNYEAAAESHKAGAEGTSILTVLTAQVSLVTAESNFVEALFDYLISDARLKLATGKPLPGEQSKN